MTHANTSTLHLKLVERSPDELSAYTNHTRTHSPKQVDQTAASMRQFGFVSPVLIDDDGETIAGHGRVEAAKKLGLKSVPTITLSHLTEVERVPLSLGSWRRRGRARRACTRIRLLMRCRPHDMPSDSMSRQTRRAP